MLEWLKDKTIGRIKRWSSRQFLRAAEEVNKRRFSEISKDIPEELREFNGKLKILNDNSWATHHLYRAAKDAGKYPEAFLYFFYGFELNLKHIIMSEMLMVNNLKFVEEQKGMFPTHSSTGINKIQKVGKISKLIELFCSLLGKDIEADLQLINRERNFIIHNMIKEVMSEEEIKQSFQNFFIKTNMAVSNSYRFFNRILEERPGRIISHLEKLASQKTLDSKTNSS